MVHAYFSKEKFEDCQTINFSLHTWHWNQENCAQQKEHSSAISHELQPLKEQMNFKLTAKHKLSRI